MGLFDWFKKKDAAFYLGLARRALKEQQWAEARDSAREGLDLAPESEAQAALKEVLTSAQREICELNLREAEISRASLETSRALECLETARVHATDGQQKARVEALVREVKALKDMKTKVA